MTIRRIESGPRMSQAVIHGNTVYLAGQVGTPGKSVGDQTRDILATIERLLKEAGSEKSKILQAIIWMADMKDFAEMNQAYKAFFGQSVPARTSVQAGLGSLRVEIDAIAVRAPRKKSSRKSTQRRK